MKPDEGRKAYQEALRRAKAKKRRWQLLDAIRASVERIERQLAERREAERKGRKPSA